MNFCLSLDFSVQLKVSLSESLSKWLSQKLKWPIVLKRQKISTWFFLCMRAACLSQIILKFRLHRSTPFSPNSVPMWLTPADLSVADIWQQIAAVWWYSGNYAESTIAFSNGIADPHDLPFSPKWGSRALSPFVKLLVLLLFQELLVSCQY